VSDLKLLAAKITQSLQADGFFATMSASYVEARIIGILEAEQPRAASDGALSAEPLPLWPCLSCGGDGGHRENCLGDLHIRENIERRILAALAAHDQKVREQEAKWWHEWCHAEDHKCGVPLWTGDCKRLAALALRAKEKETKP